MKTYKSTIDNYKIVKEPSDIPKVKITSSKDANEYVRNFYFEDLEVYESMFLLLLNRNNNTTGYVKISQGGITGTVVDVKIICKYAIDNLASSAILTHNHPSGNNQPSEADRNITKKVKEALAILDCNLIDHIIITKDSYLSFADEGLL